MLKMVYKCGNTVKNCIALFELVPFYKIQVNIAIDDYNGLLFFPTLFQHNL